MNGRHKFVLSCVMLIVLFSMISVYKSTNNAYRTIVSFIVSTANDSFTRQIWKNMSYLNKEKYERCLTWRRNDAFWAVQHIRHTAFKNLLNSSSLIVEVGGNTGLDTSKFVELYNCSIISFEPLAEMSKILIEKFQTNSKVEIQPYGLGNYARKIEIEPVGNTNEGTSIFRKLSKKNSTKTQSIEILDIVQTIENIRKTKTSNGIIDMISINCEGCEFEILPALILNNLTQSIRIIQFGSHMEFFNNSSIIYCQMEQGIERTHKIIYQYTMLWEAWVMK
ncbi:hypothetical protein I4U23_012405 [Adineta vaga]|nr:hypothetical protein I4U23_012405 [Adineta vaga]